MSAHQVDPGSRESPDAHVAADLSGRWLLIGKACWFALALLSLVYFAYDLSGRFPELTLYWFNSNPAPPSVVQEGLDNLGLSPGLYAGYALALFVIRATTWYAVGILIFWRRPAERIALLVSLLLLALSVGDTDPPVLREMAAEQPVRAAVAMVVGTVGFTLLLWLFFLFPDGRFRPRWTPPVAVGWFLVGAGTFLLPGSLLDVFSWPPLLAGGFVPVAFAVAVYAQVWRYRRISGPVERQQAKWFALGLAVVMGDFAMVSALTEYSAIAWPAVSPTRVVLTDLILYSVHTLSFLAVPVALAIAILRYRLFDIDILINRALVYGSLSTILAAIYLGGVVLLQSLFRAATGQGSNVAIAASTLVIAALFQPLRQRLQATIDRRFYRRKYDATRTLAAFGSALRNETDLGHIQSRLVAVVNETMQPAHTSLWLRPLETRTVESSRALSGDGG